jgi:hypothetical protein
MWVHRVNGHHAGSPSEPQPSNRAAKGRISDLATLDAQRSLRIHSRASRLRLRYPPPCLRKLNGTWMVDPVAPGASNFALRATD